MDAAGFEPARPKPVESRSTAFSGFATRPRRVMGFAHRPGMELTSPSRWSDPRATRCASRCVGARGAKFQAAARSTSISWSSSVSAADAPAAAPPGAFAPDGNSRSRNHRAAVPRQWTEANRLSRDSADDRLIAGRLPLTVLPNLGSASVRSCNGTGWPASSIAATAASVIVRPLVRRARFGWSDFTRSSPAKSATLAY